MKVIYKKEKSIIEQIDEAIVNASMYNKKIDKIVLTKEEFERVGNQLFSVDDYTYAYKNIVIELDEDEREDISEDDIDFTINSYGDTLSNFGTVVSDSSCQYKKKEDADNDDFVESLLKIYEMLGLLPPKESK